MEMKSVSIIFPNQLFQQIPEQMKGSDLLLIEEVLFFRQFNFHVQKLAFHRASMKAYAESLRKLNFQVGYIDTEEDHSDIRKLIPKLFSEGYRLIYLYDPVDDWLLRRINSSANSCGLKTLILPNPGFLETTESLSEWFAGRKNYFQTDFYIRQRKRHGILIDAEGGPVNGKWTFDSENRLKYPKNRKPPVLPETEMSEWHWEANDRTKTLFLQNPGKISGPVNFPETHSQAEAWLIDFFQYRFKDFGHFEDAIVSDETVLHHALITPMLNSGLLTPQQVVRMALDAADEYDIPFNSLEGFIRQIIGWREFIRGVYLFKGREQRTANFWEWSRKMPSSFYTGTTGIKPVDDSIEKVLSGSYNHHIERLMVLGNFMLLCEIHPDEVYKWFMEMYIDAYDWVMVPNVYGMSQFADGGLMCTKPYISGSNYILKMSNYQSGQPWAETWDALFWRFMDRQRSFFLKNPRMGMLIRTYDKMDPARRKDLQHKAETFLEKI